MTAPLIGLVGKKRAGKDTFAERLIAEHGFVKVSFSAPVKEAALAVDPIIADRREFDGMLPGPDYKLVRLSEVVQEFGWEEAKTYSEVRRFLQRLGTDAIRALDPDFWVRAGMLRAQRLRSDLLRFDDGLDNPPTGYERQASPVVITDVRFANEARAITDAGGILVRVERPDADDGDTHASEVELDTYPVDKLVYNGGTVQQLHNEADAVAASL